MLLECSVFCNLILSKESSRSNQISERMIAIKPFLICLISNFLVTIKAQEPISNAQRLFEFIKYGPLGLLYGILPTTIGSLNISEQCSRSLNHTIDELHNGALWSNLMIASSGKGLNNLLQGSYLNLGNYDQCLSIVSEMQTNRTLSPDNFSKSNAIRSNITDHPIIQFNGKYCLLDIVPQQQSSTVQSDVRKSVKSSEYLDSTLNISQKIEVLFRFPQQLHSKIGFCLPSTCTEIDATILTNSVFEEYSWKLLGPIECQTNEKLSFGNQFLRSRIEIKISFIILFLLFASVLLSTVLHIFVVEFDGFCNELILCFSLKRTVAQFVSFDCGNCTIILDFLQSLVILFCIISHTYLYFLWLDAFVVYDKIYDHLFLAKNIFYQPFINMIDINTGLLFLVSSTMACIELFSIENIDFIKCTKIIALHWIKYWPIMIILVAGQLVLPLFVSGPIANQFFNRDAEFCSQSWYLNLLFLNNFISYDKQCVLTSWIISTEMQLFILMTILVLIYSKAPTLAKWLNLLFIFASVISIVGVVYLNFLSPQIVQMPINLNNLKTRAKLIHFAPYSHLLEYLLSLFVFNLIFKQTIKRFQPVTRKIFFYFFIFAFVIIQFYSFPFNSTDYEGTPVLNAFVIITVKLMVPVFFVWILSNYYDFGLKEICEEIASKQLSSKLLLSGVNRRDNRRNNRANSIKSTDLKNNDFEMINSVPIDENDRLMNEKNDFNGPLTNGNLLGKIVTQNLLAEKLFNLNSTVNQISIDKFLIEMQEKIFKNRNFIIGCGDDGGHCLAQFNLVEYLEKSPLESKLVHQNTNSFKHMLFIYTKLAKSIYYTHHFYLSYDLYSIRNSLSTDLYDVISRFVYNLFYIHLMATLFYCFIEQPLISFTKLIYTRIFRLINSIDPAPCEH